MRVEIEMDLPARRTSEPRAAGSAAPKRRASQLSQRERMARQLALAYHIDALIVRGEASDFAEVASLCGVSRARVSQIHDRLGLPAAEQEGLLASLPASPSASPS